MDGKKKYSFYVEDKALEVTERPRKFLEAFAAVLQHSNYYLALDAYSRLSTKCSRCAANCQLYQSTGEDRDIPCQPLGVVAEDFPAVFHPGWERSKPGCGAGSP